jgi:hypothetical protein
LRAASIHLFHIDTQSRIDAPRREWLMEFASTLTAMVAPNRDGTTSPAAAVAKNMPKAHSTAAINIDGTLRWNIALKY